MWTLTISEGALRFPARCMRCGAPPAGAYFVRGTPRTIEVPLCGSCSTRHTAVRAGWVVGSLVLAALFVLGVATFVDAFVALPAEPGLRRAIAMGIAIALLGFATVSAIVAIRAGLSAHLARFAPVSLVAQRGTTLELAFRDQRAAHEVAVASGLVSPASSYREAAPITTYTPRGSAAPAFFALGLGLVSFAMVVIRAHELGGSRPVSMHVLEALVLDVAGPRALLATWSCIGVLFSVAGALVWRARPRV